MNAIWISIIFIGTIILIIINPNIAFSTFLKGSENAISLTFKLWTIYAFWLGILKIIEDVKLNEKFAKILNKPIDFVFGKNLTKNAKSEIATNLSCNILGMGNASVPSGIKAITLLNNNFKYASNEMITLIILNTCNLQLIPSTIIGMRIFQKSTSPTKIIIPIFFVSIICLIIAITLCKLFSKIFKNKEKNA